MAKNKKIYQNFQEIWEDFPDMQVAAIHWNITKNKQELCISHEADKWQYLYPHIYRQRHEAWRYLSIDPAQDWLKMLASQNKLKCLVWEIEDKSAPDHATRKDYAFPAIPCLERLHISIDAPRITVGLHIDNFPTLTHIVLDCSVRTLAIVSQVGKMPVLESFHAARVHIPDVPAVLAQFNPEKLERLRFYELRDFSFLPTPAQEGERLALMETFTRLTFLSLTRCRLMSLPFSLRHFQALNWLELNGNKLETFPSDIVLLPPLYGLDISRTSLTQKQRVRSTQDLWALINGLGAVQASAEDKLKLFSLLICDETPFRDASVGELLRLALLTRHKGVRQNALSFCEKKMANPLLDNPELRYIGLVGELHKMNIATMNEHLAKKQIRVSKRISKKTQILCIGDNPTKGEWELIAENTLPVCFASHLRELVYQEGTHYLLTLDPESEDNFMRLLGNSDTANVRIALQMMGTGGLPPLLFEYLCLWCVDKLNILREEVFALLKRYGSRLQMTQLRRCMQEQIFCRTPALLASSAFDAKKMVQAIIKYRALGKHVTYLLSETLAEVNQEAWELWENSNKTR